MLALAQEWTSAWIMRGAIWVTTSGVTWDGSGVAPPKVAARVIGRNGSATVELFEELSRHEYPLVRLIAVRSVEPDSAANLELDEAVAVIEEHLQLSKPDGTVVQFINLVFSPSKLDGADASILIEKAWTANIVVSPEDRRTGNSFDAFTRHSDTARWNGFVLAHIATASGLWATLPAGPYDEREFDGYMEGTHIQRVAIRGVLTGAFVVNVASQAMELVTSDRSPLLDPLIAAGEKDLRLLPPDQQSRAIDDLVGVTLKVGHGQLAYQPVPGPTPLPQRRIGAMRQARELLGFGKDKLVDIPGWFSRKVKQRASRKASKTLHGDESDTKVDVDRILSWEDAQFVDELASINRRREAVVTGLDDPVPARRYDIDGGLFESIREACFSLIDGSPLPEGNVLSAQIAQGGSPTVVSSVSALVPDWRHTWQPPADLRDALGPNAPSDERNSDWLDVAHTHKWLADMDKRLARLSQRESQLLGRLGDLQAEAASTEEELAQAQADTEYLEDEVRWLEEDLDLQRALEGPAGADDD
jgi:hypothetical protein